MNRVNTALHEAAHAVVATVLDYRVESVSIETTTLLGRIVAGGTRIARRPGRHYGLSDELAVAFAGMAVAGPEGGGLDMYTARLHYADRRLHLAHLGEAERLARYNEAYERADRIAREHARAVDRLAVRLLERGRLDGDEVRRIIEDTRVGRIA